MLCSSCTSIEDNANQLAGIHTLVVVPPQAYDDRVGVAKAYATAAKAAGVKHIIVRAGFPCFLPSRLTLPFLTPSCNVDGL